MKHNLKITFIILVMFLMTQFIGLYVINHYLVQENPLPYGMESPEIQDNSGFYTSFFPSIIVAFIFAVLLLIVLTKFSMGSIIKFWFFIVVLIAIGIFFVSFFPNQKYISFLALIFALPLALSKIYKRNFLIHNLTELIIYPSIATIFVSLLNFWTILFLLILISVYDMWAVWHSGIMQKMAKYQINELGIFGGFFLPYLSKKMKAQLSKIPKSKLRNKKVKVNVAMLGGGDVVFPIITAGVVLLAGTIFLPWGILPTIFFEGGVLSALLVIVGAALGLSYLLFFAEKKKFYPAMPFITAGILLGMVARVLISQF